MIRLSAVVFPLGFEASEEIVERWLSGNEIMFILV
jgi:hypothetical protein